MKILIADDQILRYKSLIGKMVDFGIPRENIKLVPSAKEAQDLLLDPISDNKCDIHGKV